MRSDNVTSFTFNFVQWEAWCSFSLIKLDQSFALELKTTHKYLFSVPIKDRSQCHAYTSLPSNIHEVTMQVKRILGKDELHITNTCAYVVSTLFGTTCCLFSKYNKNPTTRLRSLYNNFSLQCNEAYHWDLYFLVPKEETFLNSLQPQPQYMTIIFVYLYTVDTIGFLNFNRSQEHL